VHHPGMSPTNVSTNTPQRVLTPAPAPPTVAQVVRDVYIEPLTSKGILTPAELQAIFSNWTILVS
jgi:hypothetical protein